MCVYIQCVSTNKSSKSLIPYSFCLLFPFSFFFSFLWGWGIFHFLKLRGTVESVKYSFLTSSTEQNLTYNTKDFTCQTEHNRTRQLYTVCSVSQNITKQDNFILCVRLMSISQQRVGRGVILNVNICVCVKRRKCPCQTIFEKKNIPEKHNV